MPESTKPEVKSAAPKVTPPAQGGLASESGDPAVQQLLAQRQTAELNDDAKLRDEVDRQLVDLGFTEYKH